MLTDTPGHTEHPPMPHKTGEAISPEDLHFARRILEAVPGLVYVFDLNETRNIYISPQLTAVLGYTAAEMREFGSELMRILLHPDDKAAVIVHFEKIRSVAGQEIFEIEYRMQHKNGHWVWLQSRDRVFAYDAAGKPAQILGEAGDITARKKLELQDGISAESEESYRARLEQEIAERSAELQQNKDLLQIVFDSAPNSIAVYKICYDFDGQVVDLEVLMMNNIGLRTIGRTHAEVTGKRYREIFPSREGESAVFKRCKQVAAKGGKDQFEYPYDWNGRIYWFRQVVDKQGDMLIVNVEDITERKQTEAQIRENTDFIEEITQITPDLITIHDAATNRILYASKSELWGAEPYRAIEGAGRVETFIYPDDQEKARAHARDRNLLSDGEVLEMELRTQQEYGSWGWVRIRCKVFKRDESGKITQFIIFTTNITAQKQSELKIEEQERFIQTIRDFISIETAGILFFNLNGSISESNKAFERMSGYSQEELRHMPHLEMMTPPEFTAATSQAIRELAAKGRTAPYEKQMIRKDGSRWWGLFAPTRLSGSGMESECVKFIIDITEQKHIEAALRESQLQTQLALEASNTIAFSLDIQRNTLRQLYSGIDGLQVVENQTYTMPEWVERIYPEDRAVFLMNLEKALQSPDELYQNEYRVILQDKKTIWLHETGRFTLDAKGNPQLLTGISADISVQKDFEAQLEALVQERTEALRESNHLLEISNKELEQFAFITSHDLQEPLRKIQLFSDRLQQSAADKLSQNDRTYLGKIIASSGQMRTLIQDLLKFSRLSQSSDPFTAVDLNHEFQNVLGIYDLRILEKEAQIEIASLPTVRGVGWQLNMLFSNLIGNALKFTHPERAPLIRIGCRTLSDVEVKDYALSDRASYVEISVQDNGIGFGQEYAEQIFEIFQRLNDATKYPGTGIGLSICSKVSAMHQGKIFAEGIPDEGATFRVWLPAHKAVLVKATEFFSATD